MNAPGSSRHLKIAVVWALSVFVLGTVGYMLIEQLSFVDALYTTVGMMATTGNVVHPLSAAGRLFTIAVTILGVGSLLYAFGVIMEFLIEGHLSQAIRRRFMENKIAALRNHYIVCGFGRVGVQVVAEFSAAHKPFVVIDENESNVQRCIERGYLALQGDATGDELLREVGIQYARCLLAATDNDAHNIYITLSARHLNSKLFIVARANHDETVAKLTMAGADRVISPYAIGGHRMANLALRPGVVELFDLMTKAGNVDLAFQEVALASTSQLIGKTMLDAQDTMSDGTMIVALRKPGGLVMGSRREVPIEKGDAVIIVGDPEQLGVFIQRNTMQLNRNS